MWLVVITVGVAITKHWRLHVGRRRLTVIRMRIRAELMMAVVRRSSRVAVRHALMIMLMGLWLLI